MGRYAGPGAALRGQPRAPRQPSSRRENAAANGPDASSDYAPSVTSPKDLPDTPRTHQRQWSDASSLQYQQHGHGYQSPYQHQSPYMGPSSRPQSPPPMSASPTSTSSYFGDQRSHAYGYTNNNNNNINNNNQYSPSPSQRQHPGYAASVASSTSSRPNQGYSQYPSQRGYNNYDQSPMMSPTSPDSWRSSPGSRGYPSQTSRQPNNNYASSVLSDDHGHQGVNGNGGRSRNYPYESDSDDYYNRQGARPSGGNNTTRGAHALSYSTSIASNTSSVLAARRERNERNERNRQRAPADEWLTSPTGTEHETEILSWSDEEAIVTKAIRSPPTGYSNEKNLPPIPGRGTTALPPQQTPSVTIPKPGQGLKRMDSDMIKVEVGGTTTVIPTEEGSGVNFIKTVSPSSSPPSSRYNFPTSSGGAQSMTGAATSLRAAAINQKNASIESPKKAGRNSSDWGGQRISLDDMLSTPSPLTRDSRQQAINSWKSSPPLKPTGKDAKDFTELKNKRRSSLPDKFVPNWNEHASAWRNSIGQRRPPSWVAPSKDDTPSKDDFLSQKQKWNDAGALSKDWEKKLAGSKATDQDKRLSDQSLRRRSRSWSPRPKDGGVKGTKRNSFASISSRSRSRSRSYSRDRAGSRGARDSFRSMSHSRSRSRSRSDRSKSRSRSRPRSSVHSRYHSHSRSTFRSRSRSRSRSHSRSRSRSPGDRYKADKGFKEDPQRDSTRFSWHSTDDLKESRRSWESMDQSKDVSKKAAGPGLGGPRYSTAGEEDLTDYDDDYKDKSGPSTSRGIFAQATSKSDDAFKDAPKKTKAVDSDSDSMDSPPLKVQYRRPGGIDDDDEPISSKHPASIISTFNLPPATSPTSPPIPPPLPSPTATKGGMDFLNYKPTPPPVPSSPPLSAQPGQSMMTSVTTVSIEAATAVMSSSRVSVASFTNVPGQSRSRDMTETDLETDFDSDNESTNFRRDKDLPQPSYVTMTSGALNTPPSSNPISINTTLKRNESTTSSVSAVSARSAKSFMSSSTVHSASSILSASPPPQRAPPPVPFGAEASTKRSDSSGSARGVRSGLSKQILPSTVPPPPGPPPEMPASGSKPSYGILPPPIPSSFTSDTAVPTPAVVTATSSAIQIQMLDEDQSRSQMGAISIETDERLLTKLNNRVAQLEKELEFAQQDLQASLDDATSLQNKVQDLEAELDDVHNSSAKTGKVSDQEFEDAKDEWRAEKDRLLKNMDVLRDDHKNDLKESLAEERSKHSKELEDLDDKHSSDLAGLKKQMEQLRDDHIVALEEAEMDRKRMQESHEQEVHHIQEQLEAIGRQHEQDLQNLRVEHESELRTTVEEWETKHENAHQEHAQALERVSVGHRQDLEKLEVKVAEAELLLTTSHTERDQAKEALEHHKKETEQALDRLEVVLAEDKKAHSELIQDLENKAKRLEDRVSELEGELRELTQDNVQIVEELQRREETWAEERALLRANAEGDESGMEARLQEMHEQLVAVTESKRQADAQFQGIVKGLLREASANKKELEVRQQELDQERQDKDNISQEVEALQEQLASVHQMVEVIQREKEAAQQKHTELEFNHQEMTRQFEDQQRSGSEAMYMAQKELESKLAEHSHQLEQERLKVQELQELMDQDRSKSGQEMQREQFVWQQRLDQLEGALKAEKTQVKKLEQEADATMKIQTDLLQSMERDAASSQKKLEASLMDKMKEMEMMFAEEKKKMQQSAEEERRRILQSSDESKMIMQKAMDEELQKVRQQAQLELTQQFETETLEKETRLQQQLDSIHQQELAMALQEATSRHEQQVRNMKREHDTTLENTKAALQQSSASLEKQAMAMEAQLQQIKTMEAQLQQAKSAEDQLERLQLQAEQERSEKEVAIKDRTFLERRMAGHDRRQKELEENLESLQQQLDQARAKSGQDVQDLERSKSNLERKLGMAKEDVEELNKIRDELESDRDELRREVQRLKKSAGSGSGSSKQESAAWEAERRGLKEQVRKLEDEVQIMLEKNMNLTIELSMK